MKRFLAAFLIAVPLFAADPAEEVRQTEIAFAKAFAGRDQAKFFSMVLDDATFLPTLRTLSGKSQVKERWSRYFEPKDAPFSWGPERVAVNAAGTIGYSTGPVYDPAGKHVGNFASVWVKQPDGTWKILFDGPGGPIALLPGAEEPFEQGTVTADDGVKIKKIALTPADLQKITMPVLTIHGTKDRNAPYGAGREWAMSLPDARLVTVHGAAHQSWADDPATVFAAIREFLREQWPRGAEKVAR